MTVEQVQSLATGTSGGEMARAAVVVVAGGRGTRASTGTGDAPKQYRSVGGRAVIAETIARLAAHPAVAVIQPVIHADDDDAFAAAVTSHAKLRAPVHGGATRQHSVRNGLAALAADPPDLVLVHDAVRPFVAAPVIDRVLAALAGFEGAIAALPVTDDAAVAEWAGLAVTLVEGDPRNVKLTTAADLAAADDRLTRLALADLPDVRVGQGFDVHAFGDGDAVTLGGISVPHGRGLEGHSDADVGLHALTDAILGAIADGDIGSHFPPTDARWRGADSAQFLVAAVERVQALGGRIAHLDLTFICEAPKIGPHRDAMRARIAAITDLPIGRIAVKATTSERLGFTGRREGIAALATATVRLPFDAEDER